MNRKLWSIVICILVYTDSTGAIFGWFRKADSSSAREVGPNSDSELEDASAMNEASSRFVGSSTGKNYPTKGSAIPGSGAQIVPSSTASTSAGLEMRIAGEGNAPGIIPGTPPGVTPGMNMGMVPGTNMGMVPGMNMGMVPGMNMGMVPGMNMGMVPGMNMGMVPGMNMGMVPGMNMGISGQAGFQICTVPPVYGGFGAQNTDTNVSPSFWDSQGSKLLGSAFTIGLGLLGNNPYDLQCLSSLVKEQAALVLGGSLLVSLFARLFKIPPGEAKENNEIARGLLNGITTGMGLLANPSLTSIGLLQALMQRAAPMPGMPKPNLLSKGNVAYAMTIALFVGGSFSHLIPIIQPLAVLAGPYAVGVSILISFSVQSGLLRGIYRTAKKVFDWFLSFFITGNSNVYSRLQTKSDRDNYLLTEEKLRELLKDEDPLLIEMRQGANKTMMEKAKVLKNLREVSHYMHCSLISNCHPCMYFGIRTLAKISRDNPSEVKGMSDSDMRLLISLTNSVVLGGGFLTALMLIPPLKDTIPGLLLTLTSGEIGHFAEFFFSLARLQPNEAVAAISLAHRSNQLTKRKGTLACIFYRLIDEKFEGDCGEESILRSYERDLNFVKALDTVVGKTRIAAIHQSIKKDPTKHARIAMIESLIKVFRAGGYNILVENNLANLLDIAWLFGRVDPDHKSLNELKIGTSSTCTPIFYARYLALRRPDADNMPDPQHKDLEPIKMIYRNRSNWSTMFDPMTFDKDTLFDDNAILAPYNNAAWDGLTVDTKTAIVELVLQLYFNTHPSKMIATRPMCHLPFAQHLRKRLKDFRTIVVAKILEAHEGGDPNQAYDSGISFSPEIQVVSSVSGSSAGSSEGLRSSEPVTHLPPPPLERENRTVPTQRQISNEPSYPPPPVERSPTLDRVPEPSIGSGMSAEMPQTFTDTTDAGEYERRSVTPRSDSPLRSESREWNTAYLPKDELVPPKQGGFPDGRSVEQVGFSEFHTPPLSDYVTEETKEPGHMDGKNSGVEPSTSNFQFDFDYGDKSEPMYQVRDEDSNLDFLMMN